MRGYRLFNGLFAALLVLILGAPLIISRLPSEVSAKLLPPCQVMRVTGRPCPTCGLTRSVLALYQGDFSRSRAMQPAGILIILFFAVQLILRVLPCCIQWRHYFVVDLCQLVVGWCILSFSAWQPIPWPNGDHLLNRDSKGRDPTLLFSAR